MIWYFKKSKILYLTSVFFGLVLLLLPLGTKTATVNGRTVTQPLIPLHISVTSPAAGVFTASLLAVLWILLCAFLAVRVANREYLKLLSLHTQNCDPAAYLNAAAVQFRSRRIRPNNFRLMLILNASAAYEALGQYEEAKAKLAYAAGFSKGRTGRILQFVYHNNLFPCFLNDGDRENAERSLSGMNALLAPGLLPQKLLAQYRELYLQKECLLKMKLGDYTEAEAVFTRQFEQAKTQIQKVSAQFTLAAVYLHRSEAEKARRSLEYTAQHGNKLAIAARARQMLQEMRETPAV